MPLQDLPEDVLIDIFQHVHVHDIVSLRQTCRALDMATRERAVWHEALSRHARHSGLPIPKSEELDQSALSASQLEALTLRALRFWSNWLSPRPKVHRSLSIRPHWPTTPARGARNLAVIFLPNHPGHILTLTLYDDVPNYRRYCFELWDVADTSTASFVDTVQVEALIGYAMNTDRGCPNTMTLTRRDPASQQCIMEVYKIELPLVQPNPCFRLLNQFPGYRNTIGLHGPRLIATDAEQDVRVLDVDSGRLEYTLKALVLLDDPTLRSPERQCMDAVIVDNFVLSFCRQYIYLYQLPSPSESSAPFHIPSEVQDAPQLDPIATYKWRWRIDTLVAQPRLEPRNRPNGSPASSASAAAPPLIDILIRFDTWFPWPVNILHHFALVPNPAYHPTLSAPANPLDPSTLPYLLSAQDGPAMVHSIPSPLRIFTPSDVALGAHGTALWIDASTDGAGPAQAGDHGQRIAGKLLTSAPLPLFRARDAGDAVSPGFVEPAQAGNAEEDPEAAAAADAGAGGIGVGAAGAVRGGTAVSVFEMHETEARWNRVAVDEEGGRVAIGHVDGTVQVLSYVPP